MDIEVRNKSLGTIQSAIICDTNGKGKSNLLGVIHTVSNLTLGLDCNCSNGTSGQNDEAFGAAIRQVLDPAASGGSSGAQKGKAMPCPYLSSGMKAGLPGTVSQRQIRKRTSRGRSHRGEKNSHLCVW